jgi:ABC-type antimicrobial peptide transport system permease subunit
VRLSRLTRIVVQSIRRNRRDFLLSSIGIVVGISTLLFFTALGSGIKQVVLEEVFVVRQLEVVKKSYGIGGFDAGGLMGGNRLDDKTVARLSKIDGVQEVYPKMKLTFPASLKGGKQLIGQDLVAELIADGIPPSLVDDEIDGEHEFRDWEEEITCSGTDDCPGGHNCENGVCEPRTCKPNADEGVCDSGSYCERETRTCMMPIPVVANPKLLEIYNSSFQTAMGGAQGMISKLPNLNEDMLIGFTFDGVFGSSYLGRSAKGGRSTRRMRFVGFTDKAIDLGATIPIGYVKRLNARFRSDEAADEYHSIVVETQSNEAVPRVAQAIEDMSGLTLSSRYENAQRAGLLVMLMTIIFNLISLIILGISAVNIMHTFLMVILERRREMGLMRALGATRGNIRLIVLGEAMILGAFGGVLGLAVGVGVIQVVDYLFATQVGDFPFKPESLFIIEWWMVAAGLGVAIVFCWLGALFPAIRASHIDPAEALSGR